MFADLSEGWTVTWMKENCIWSIWHFVCTALIVVHKARHIKDTELLQSAALNLYHPAAENSSVQAEGELNQAWPISTETAMKDAEKCRSWWNCLHKIKTEYIERAHFLIYKGGFDTMTGRGCDRGEECTQSRVDQQWPLWSCKSLIDFAEKRSNFACCTTDTLSLPVTAADWFHWFLSPRATSWGGNKACFHPCGKVAGGYRCLTWTYDVCSGICYVQINVQVCDKCA